VDECTAKGREVESRSRAIVDVANGSSPDDLVQALDDLFEFLRRHSTDGRA
jgi:hypothetical protein